jgi:hypothetical protein
MEETFDGDILREVLRHLLLENVERKMKEAIEGYILKFKVLLHRRDQQP